MFAVILGFITIILAVVIIGKLNDLKSETQDHLNKILDKIKKLESKLSHYEKTDTGITIEPEHIDIPENSSTENKQEEDISYYIPAESVISKSKEAGPENSVTEDNFKEVTDQKEQKIEEPITSDEKTVKLTPKIVEDARTVLKKIWSWILVGEEYRPENMSMEYAIASTWLMRFGIVAIVFCIGYLLNSNIDNKILSETTRVVISIAVGIAVIFFGLKQIGKAYHLLGQGFIGGGFAILYNSIYAVGPLYNKIPIPLAFGLMFLLTISSGLIAVKLDSLLIAILGIIGGYCTPLLLNSSVGSPNVFYGYLLILSLGILGISHIKQWRLLNYLGFIFTWTLILYTDCKIPDKIYFANKIVFLSLFFMIHSMITFYFNLIKRKQSVILDIIHLILNTTMFAGMSYELINHVAGRPYPAIMSISVTIYFIVEILFFLKIKVTDKNLLTTLIGMAAFFLIWSIPLLAKNESLTISWAIMAFVMLWLGFKLKSNLMRWISAILYIIVIYRAGFMEIPDKFTGNQWISKPIIEYWKMFLTRLWTIGTVIASVFGAHLLCNRRAKAIDELVIKSDNDIKLQFRESYFMRFVFWAGIIFTFIYLFLETGEMFSFNLSLSLTIPMLVLCSFTYFIISRFMKSENGLMLFITLMALFIIVLKQYIYDFHLWLFTTEYHVFNSHPGLSIFRLIQYAGILYVIYFAVRNFRTKTTLNGLSKGLTIIGLVLLITYTTLEIKTFFYHYLRDFMDGAVSMNWAFFAIAFVIFGIVKDSKAYRFSGLIMFLIVMIKVFFIDLSEMPVIYRVLAFLIVGILMIFGSFLYLKSNSLFKLKGKSNED